MTIGAVSLGGTATAEGSSAARMQSHWVAAREPVNRIIQANRYPGQCHYQSLVLKSMALGRGEGRIHTQSRLAGK